MKNTIHYILLLLFVLGWLSNYAQDTPGNAGKGQAKKLDQTILTKDAKLSADEQATFKKAGEDNPSKAPPLTPDPKMDPAQVATEKDYGDANARPGPLGSDPKLSAATGKDPSISSAPSTDEPSNLSTDKRKSVDQTQPVGKSGGTNQNYRLINGPNTQPMPETSGKVINHKGINGPNTQPPGDKPKR
jgi:hypothetical protein